MKKHTLAAFVFLLFTTAFAIAQQDFKITITEGMPAVKFALPPFLSTPGAKAAAEQIQAVFEADIKYTRVFELLPKTDYSYIRPLTDHKNPNFQEWESIAAAALFTAQVSEAPSGGLIFEWYLFDVKSRRSIVAKRYQYTESNVRHLAHLAADDIMKWYGEKPIFTSKIAFVSNRDKNEELYLMDYDGANQSRLTYNKVNDSNPAWDPSGQRLAYSSWQDLAWKTIGVGVYILDVYAGQRTPVSLKGGNYTPAWSPDGKKLAFSSTMGGNHEIYVAEIESNPTRVGRIKQLTFNQGVDIAPSWSNTGREIVFTSDRGGTTQIYIMDAEGGNLRRISEGANHHDAPAWSPNGDRIVYVARVDNAFDLYLYHLSSGRISKLTESNARNESPTWSPDGRHIIYTSNVGKTNQIHVIDLDGANPRKLTSLGENKLGKWAVQPPGSER
jgi:TolB protein